MKPNDAISIMLSSINNDNLNHFYKTVENYTESLSKSGSAYGKIKRLLNQKPKKLSLLKEIPRELKTLIKLEDVKEDNVYLNNEIKSLIDELLIEWDNFKVYKYHNLPIRNKILLHGPTGNGKTTIAKHIAKLSKLPFIEINSDMVIDSHIGSSGRSIFKIFDQINEPCILFWDEVDTIGRMRGVGNDSAAGLENERMVNSMLINIEKLGEDVIFIGATNRYKVLDPAFLRRFDVKFELIAPNINQKKVFVKQMQDFYKIPESFINSDIMKMESYSEIKMNLVDSARKYVLLNLT